MKILYHPKDNPYSTDSGYAIVSRAIVEELSTVHDLSVFAPVGTRYKIQYYHPEPDVFSYTPTIQGVGEDGKTSERKGIPILPGTRDDYNEDVCEMHYNHMKADLLLMMSDIWALNRIPQLCSQGKMRWINSTPLDFLDPIPRYVLDILKSATKIVPWTWEATNRLRNTYGLTNIADPIPLGLSCDNWKPLDRSKFPITREALMWKEDTFNILIVAANQWLRKGWAESFDGISKFIKDSGTKVSIYIHTYMDMPGGWNLIGLSEFYGLKDVMQFSDPYDWMNGLYSDAAVMKMFGMADCVVNAGMEGFGMATIQAQAVGTPVIGLAEGATKELVHAGVTVPIGSTIQTPELLIKAMPSAESIATALYEVKTAPRSKWQDGPRWVRENYDWKVVIPKWFKLMKEFEDYLEDNCISSNYPPKPSPRELAMAQKVRTYG